MAPKIASDSVDHIRDSGTHKASEAAHTVQTVLMSSLSKIAGFLLVAMPIIFIGCMMLGAYAMSHLEDWPYHRGYNFMASALTGGAIVFPADPPRRTSSKIWASLAGAAGLALFGFVVATLSNSLVDPIIHVFGLTSHGSTVQGVYGKLLGFAAIVMCANLFFAVVFGSIFAYVDNADIWDAIKATASIELGGGVVFHEQHKPQTAQGTMLYTIVGVWAIGVAAAMVSVAGGPATTIVEDRFDRLRLKGGASWREASNALGVLVLGIMPASLFAVMFLVAGVMQPFTAWHFEGAFWAALPATTGGAAALASPHSAPLKDTASVAPLIFAASGGFFLLSVFIGVGSEMMGPIIDDFPSLQVKAGAAGTRAIAHSLLALLVIAFVLVPIAVFLFAVPIGGVLAYVEGWQFVDGFWWCVAVQLGGGMALTDAQVHSFTGMILGTTAVAWSIGISILCVGLAGAPVVVPLMAALGLEADEAQLQAVVDASKSWGTYGTAEMAAEAQKKEAA